MEGVNPPFLRIYIWHAMSVVGGIGWVWGLDKIWLGKALTTKDTKVHKGCTTKDTRGSGKFAGGSTIEQPQQFAVGGMHLLRGQVGGLVLQDFTNDVSFVGTADQKHDT